MAKKVFWPAFGCTQHQKAGQNTQRLKIRKGRNKNEGKKERKKERKKEIEKRKKLKHVIDNCLMTMVGHENDDIFLTWENISSFVTNKKCQVYAKWPLVYCLIAWGVTINLKL